MWGRLLLALGVWAGVVLPMLVAAALGPTFSEIYREFGVRVSPVLSAVIAVSRGLGTPAGLVFMLAVLPALCLGAATLVLRPVAAGGRARPWGVAGLLAASLAWGVGGLAAIIVLVFLPMIEIQEKLSAGAPARASTPAAAPVK